MFKNYFKIACRNIFRNRTFSVTNILGLTIGMTSSILILLWIQDELSFDKSQKNYDNIYQVMANRDFENNIFTDQAMVFPLAGALKKSYPQIENSVVSTWSENHMLKYGDDKLIKSGYTVEGDYFKMFSWKFVKGNASSALADPSSVVLTESAAKAIFGNSDPINKMIKVDDEVLLKVSAIIADPPSNSTFKFDFIKSFDHSDPNIVKFENRWRGSSWNVFVQLKAGTTIDMLNKSINAVQKQNNPDDKISTYFAFPMSKWHLYSEFKDGKNVGGMIDYVKLFGVIAIIILLMACVNFMNLSTARSEKRAKEVGIRKTLGSLKKQLIFQFFSESALFSAIAFVISILAVLLLLPIFNSLVGKELSLNLISPAFWLGSLAIVIFTGIIAGSYPALYLSSFNPVKVLKGTFIAGKNASLPRRVLVVCQFAVSILLISATIIVYKQLQHVKDRNTGYDPNNLIMIQSSPDLNRSFSVLKQELLNTGLISGVTRSSAPVTEIWWRDNFPSWVGKPENMNIIISGLATDVDFTKTMGIKMLEGRDFSGKPADSLSMMLNKAAIDAAGLKNPVGMKMKSGGKEYTVIGVADNVIMESPYNPVQPLMVFYNGSWGSKISIRLKDGVSPEKGLEAIEALNKKFNPSFPLEYQFVDEEFGKKLTAENRIGKLTNIFAALAIFICCIGLAGLASFTIERRLREIGVRKVLGASVQSLLMLISREFIRLATIAFLIAIPATWWFMNNWLQQYAYRIEISIWIFALVGCIIFLLTLVVVCLNTITAALANPVKSLRAE